jgi:uncharacterized membrane protein YraQ (UPF0718 family)
MVLKKYRFSIAMILVMGLAYLINRDIGAKAIGITASSLFEMLSLLPPIFILLGLLDLWVPKETMIKYLGEHSGLTGVLISFLMGSATAGPLYGAFPVAAVLMKKGAKFSNIMVFIGAWSTTKIPMFLFEISALGSRFAISRLLVDIVAILLIARIVDRSISKEDLKVIYQKVEQI